MYDAGTTQKEAAATSWGERFAHKSKTREHCLFNFLFVFLTKKSGTVHVGITQWGGAKARQGDEDSSLNTSKKCELLTQRGFILSLCHCDFMASQRIAWILFFTKTFRKE